MKIITVVGARPQFIKAAVVSRALKARTGMEEKIIHTGQHFDASMSDVFFEEMDIPKPAYHLDIHSLSHGAMTGRMTEQIEAVLMKEKPDAVLVYGDTDSTLAGALAAAKLHIPIAHVEAGLRSFDRRMPEEINRVLTDHLSRWLFCPTDTAVENLKREGIVDSAAVSGAAASGSAAGVGMGNVAASGSAAVSGAGFGANVSVCRCGDVMQDAALFYAQRARAPQVELPNEFALCTLHRPANTDDSVRLLSALRALETISPKLPVVFPLHPRTRQKMQAFGYDKAGSNIRFIEPVGYLEMVYLLSRCRLVMTDSGGLQKEAYFFGKYGLTLRENTEWTELVEHGYNILCDTDFDRIMAGFEALMQRPPLDKSLALYGHGRAGEEMVSYLGKNH